jgi:hypothetical protein
MKSSRLLSLAILLVLCLPVLVHADASVRQDSCVVVGPDQVRIYFTVFNEGLPRSICSFQLIPEDQPPTQQCTAVDAGPAAGWTSALNSFGGADYNALPPEPPLSYCIDAWDLLGGFYVTIDPGFCCYWIKYADETGGFIMQEKECFTSCGDVSVEQKTWGNIKKMYEE